MPRTKTLPDDAVLDAAERAMLRHGPAGFTLAQAAAESGLAVPTLIQRFGDKQALIRNVMARSNERFFTMLEALPPGSGTPSVVDLVGRVAEPLGGEASPSGRTPWLIEDFRDPALNAFARTRLERLREAIADRLPRTVLPPATVAAVVVSAWQGAIMWWRTAPQGRLADHVRGTIEALFTLIEAGPGTHFDSVAQADGAD